MKVIVAVAFVGVAALAILVAVIANRRRKEALTQAFTALGFELNLKPDPGRKEEIAGAVAKDLPRGTRHVRWVARGSVGGRDVRIFEHAYTVSTGKSSTTYYNTGVSIDAPETWPSLKLGREGLLHKLADLFRGKDLQVENEAFNKRWRITGDDDDFARLVLGPDVQAWLMEAPKHEWWRIGAGVLCCGCAARVKPENLEEFVKRPAELLAILPAELKGWGPT